MLLKHLPPDARPREKLLARGASALSDAELLALLLRTGLQGKNVIALAQEIVDRFGGVAGLLQADAQALQTVKGLGPAKQAELIAVMELARRALAQQLATQTVFDAPQTLLDFVRLHIGSKPYEVFAVVFLDSQQKLIAWEELFRGSLKEATVYPRDVAVRALHHHAASVILAHNHPSGDRRISQADQTLTQHMRAALQLLDIALLDHVITTRDHAFSMLEQGYL